MNIAAKILELLSNTPNGVLQSNLAKALGVSKAYLSIVLRELEKQNLVYRVRVGSTYLVKLVLDTKHRIEHEKNSKKFRLGIVWSSEYLFLGHLAKNLREKMGIDLDVHVYPNGIQTVLALIKNEIDASVSPMVTQIYGYIISRSFYITGGGVRGGGYVYEIPDSKTDTIISSEISTMDLCRYLALKHKYIANGITRYFSSAQEAISLAKKKMARYAVVWHPLNIELEVIGGKKIFDCLDLEEIKYCCTFSISKSFDYDFIETISKIYTDSIDMFRKRKDRYLEWYSSIIGIDVSVLKKVLNHYVCEPHLEIKYFDKIVDVLGITLPHKIQLYKAIPNF